MTRSEASALTFSANWTKGGRFAKVSNNQQGTSLLVTVLAIDPSGISFCRFTHSAIEDKIKWGVHEIRFKDLIG
ncbi:MAG: hypothetical protein LWX54_07845 [Deltaproteobacteria bacterium]|nr:hypothetical protein [Deltaproteobacteria bacterium]